VCVWGRGCWVVVVDIIVDFYRMDLSKTKEKEKKK
jgi:hypothetical protein